MKLLSLILVFAFFGLVSTANAQKGNSRTKKKPATSTKNGGAQAAKDKYDVTPNGLKYKFFKKGNGKKPLLNDMMTVDFMISYKDSVLRATRDIGGPGEIPCMAPMFKGDIMEGLALMGEGDSAVFLMVTDSFFRGGEMPKSVKSGDFLNFNVKLLKVKSAAEVQQEHAAASAGQMKKDTMQIREYLNANNIKAQHTASGLYYTFTKRGNGAQAMPGKTVAVHYTGKLLNGKVFDSSRDRGEPISFPLGTGQVIPGWDEGIALLREGDVAMLFIPSTLGYGGRAAGPIPPNSVLVFEVELVSVGAAPKPNLSPAEQLKMDTMQIREYLNANHIVAKRTASGLYYTISKNGTGAQAMKGQTVSVHYTGKLLNGKKFDSSRDRGQPFSFPLGAGRVIRGWDEGIALLKEGDVGTLFIPSSLGYGTQGAGADIPANAVLIFDVELLSAK